MRNKLGLVIVSAVVIATVGYAFIASEPQQSTTPVADSTQNTSQSQQATQQPQPPADESRTIVADGRYTDFTQERRQETGYSTTILFFYASWCPECRGFDQAIQASAIPKGTQILRVNYDQAQELRQQYGVTIQTTFVSVSSDGTQLKKWIGYGQDKSIDAVLQNVSD
jgi:thioredoxin-like negative regulator of GroEL